MRQTKKVKVKNALGLHARPATSIVKILQTYKSSVTFTYRKETINARSIMSILMLAVQRNAVLEVNAEGEDAEALLTELASAFENKFGEADGK